MPTPINVSVLTPSTINSSGSYSVTFSALGGTLNIAGSPSAPIDVTLETVAGILAGDTVNITDANVTLGGAAGVTGLATYNIGNDSKLILLNTANLSLSTTFAFTGSSGLLGLTSGVNLGLLSGVRGFTPGNKIDVSGLAASATYSGGVLTLRDGNNTVVAAVTLTNGTYATGDFRLTPDGNGGTVVDLAVGTMGITASPTTADLKAGSTVRLTVNTALPVVVTGAGTPTLTLSNGGVATWNAAASTGAALAFDYLVAPGQDVADLAVTGMSNNGATILDGNGVPLDTQHVAANPAGILQIDTTAPVISSITTSPGSGMVTVGQTVMINVVMSENVTVSGGAVTLSLNDGGVATLMNASGTNLQFGHTVQPGQATGKLAVLGVNLNGATVVDGAGNAANLTAAPPPTNGLTVDGSGGGGGGGTGGTTGTTVGTGGANPLGVYRFFDLKLGTHFFTSDAGEKTGLATAGGSTYRSDLALETNNFGAVSSSVQDPNKIEVYRFFDQTFGTHFFTSDAAELKKLTTPGASGYRSDLVLESSASFYEHGSAEAGDVAVFRFFDKVHGTHFYTGDASEYAAITTPGSSGFRSDLVSEGIAFYAPSGSYR